MYLVLGQQTANISTDFPHPRHCEGICLICLLIFCALCLICDFTAWPETILGWRGGTVFQTLCCNQPQSTPVEKTAPFQAGIARQIKLAAISIQRDLLCCSRFPLLSVPTVHVDTRFYKWSWQLVQKQNCLWTGFLGAVVLKETWMFG